MFTKESLKNPSWLILSDFFIHIYRDAWYDLELNIFPTDVLELSDMSDNATWNVIPGENVRRNFLTAVVILC